MLDYISGALILLALVLFSFLIGCATRKEIHFAKNTLTGYLIYSFLIAIVFIPIQILKFSWFISLIFWLMIMIALIIYIIYQFSKHKDLIKELKRYPLIKNYWLLFIICIILVILSVLNVELFWLSNHLDDGYYLTKITNLPYLEQPFNTNYASGIVNTSTTFDTYLLNVWELEASIIVYLTKIDGVIFARLFLSAFNYLLFALSVYILAEKLFENIFKDKKYPLLYLQASSLILLVFTFNMSVMVDTNLIVLQDSWQFNSAMYYGAMFIRTIGILCYFIYFIDIKEITLKNIFSIIALSIILISKSTVILPLAVMLTLALYCVIRFFNHEKKGRILAMLFILIYIAFTIICSNNLDMENLVVDNIRQNSTSILGIFSIMMILLSFVLKSKIIYRINLVIVVLFLLILLPEINDGFELFSQYNFVALRTLSSIYYFAMIVAFIYLLIFLHKYLKIKKLIYSLIYIILISSFGLSLFYLNDASGPLIHNLRTVNNNRGLMPKSTIMLAKRLETIAEFETVNVMMPSMIYADNFLTPVSTIIRVNAPNVNSISALSRYPINDNSIYAEFSINDQIIFESFVAEQNIENYQNVIQIFEKYGVNYFVLVNGINENLYDFSYVDSVVDMTSGISYSIYKV